MNKIINIVLSILFIFVSFSCAEDTAKKEVKKSDPIKGLNKSISNQHLNISFLLDLSDRINPTKYPNVSMEFYERDIAYIKSVSEAFDMHLRKKRVRQMNDKIQLYFDPEPLNKNINNISSELRYHITKDNVSLDLLDNIKKRYATKPLEVYNFAINDNKYIGSDTWRFFKTKVKDYCIEDEYRNILIILTDGYIYHKNTRLKEGNLTSYLTPQDIRKFKLNSSKWKEKMERENFGFIPVTDNLGALEVLVLGIHPDTKNPYEEDVITEYWSNWLTTMKVKRYQIKNAGLPSNMDKIIKDFILK